MICAHALFHPFSAHPPGCPLCAPFAVLPFQVRNLRSCIKVAVDFVSPEALPHCKAMSAQLRTIPQDLSIPPHLRFYQDKLQVWNGV